MPVDGATSLKACVTKFAFAIEAETAFFAKWNSCKTLLDIFDGPLVCESKAY
jgi:hypothetical protein